MEYEDNYPFSMESTRIVVSNGPIAEFKRRECKKIPELGGTDDDMNTHARYWSKVNLPTTRRVMSHNRRMFNISKLNSNFRAI